MLIFLGRRFESRRGHFFNVYTLLVLGHAGSSSRLPVFLLVFYFYRDDTNDGVLFFLFPLSPLWGDDQRLVLGPLFGAKALLDLNLGPPYMPAP